MVSRPYRFSENIWLVEIFTRVNRKSKHGERKRIVWRVAKMGKVFGFEDKNRKVVDYSQNTEVKKPVWRDRGDRLMLMLVLILKRREECK